AVGDVDVRIDAALADQPEPGQALEQGLPDLRALADQHQRLDVREAPGERVGVLDVVVPHRDIVALEPAEAREGAQGVVVVVEDGDLHRRPYCRAEKTKGGRSRLLPDMPR